MKIPRGKYDLHVHTTFCDGKNTAEETVLTAISRGMDVIGFSGHSHTPFDESYCMSVEGTERYREEILRLRKKYRGKIKILLGIEQDLFSDIPAEGYDYVIGSVHYFKLGDEYVPVDHTAAIQKAAADGYFGGDMISLAEVYFDEVARVAETTGCDIVGHFDLVTKFNEDGLLFDVTDPRYVRAWQAAVDRLIPSGALFEINTGAITRGYRKTPYPAPDIYGYIKERGGRFILSGDVHRAENLGINCRWKVVEGQWKEDIS